MYSQICSSLNLRRFLFGVDPNATLQEHKQPIPYDGADQGEVEAGSSDFNH